ncbi:MAG: hypothetical protein Q4D28_07985, partial [Prevotellaceae bacterium]|nr:hypothetical protein [Prevotellaceae bacterium]
MRKGDRRALLARSPDINHHLLYKKQSGLDTVRQVIFYAIFFTAYAFTVSVFTVSAFSGSAIAVSTFTVS